MKAILTILAVSFSVATAEETEMSQFIERPKLSTIDIAWMEGITFTKGILPWEEGQRIGSVSLVIEYASGKRKTLIGPLSISYPDVDPDILRSRVREVLVAYQIIDGRYEFFLGWNRGGYKNSMKKSISLKDVGIRSTKHFGARNLPTEPEFSYVVPIGESEIFTFLTTKSKPLARILVVSEPHDADNPVNSPENSKKHTDD